MPNTGLKGPYLLTNEQIDQVVTSTSPGVYALGILSQDGRIFYVYYIGRSDSNINTRIKQHIAGNTSYTHFKFDYFPSPQSSFDKECRLWHDWGGDKGALDNVNHPGRPEGTDWKCPICQIFG